MTTPEIKSPMPEMPSVKPEMGEKSQEAPAPLEQNIQPTPGPFQVQPPTAPQAQPSQQDDTNVVTITVPATPQQLEDWAKGPTENALTWLSFYWIRMIKKALFHGWRVMTAQSPAGA